MRTQEDWPKRGEHRGTSGWGKAGGGATHGLKYTRVNETQVRHMGIIDGGRKGTKSKPV